MTWKKKYALTVLEDLTPREARTLVEVAKNYEPEDEPVSWPPWVRWIIAALIIVACLWFLFGG